MTGRREIRVGCATIERMGFFDVFKSRPKTAAEDRAAEFRGRHYLEWVPELDELRRERRDDELLELLIGILDATDRHAKATGREPAAGYYKQAAILYRRRGEILAEIEVIERWENACPPGHRPGADSWSTLRKARARELLAKNQP
jgi:hypothetical protein